MKPERTGKRQNWNTEASRTIAGALTRAPRKWRVPLEGRKSPKIYAIREVELASTIALPLAAALAAARGRGGGCGRVWSSGHARAVAETAGCRLGSRRSRRSARLELRRRARAAAEGADRQGKSPPVGRSVAWSVARSVLVELSVSCVGVLQ